MEVDTATATNKTSPSADTKPRTHVNALKMLEEGVFDEGYDSDGYIGPPRGTDAAELEALEEEAVLHNTPPEPPAEEEEEDDTAVEPVHVPMTEEQIKQLTIPLIKEELRLRRVPFKASLKKDALIEKLREALSQQSPKYTQEQLDSVGAGTKKKKEDDMTAFKVGAWWRELHPMEEQLDEPSNDQFPAARAPTIPEEDREVPLKPKYNYAEKWDRIPFKGSAHGQERVKGRANDAFLKAHNLDKDSSPVEFAEAFLPMFKNTKPWIPNPNKDPVKECKNLHGRFFSMEECARVTNMRAQRAFVGEATYREQFTDLFTVKEIRQYLGLYVLNGLSPSPSLDKKFERNDKANFNPFVNANVGGANPQKRLKIFKAYFGIQDPDKEVPPRKDSPLFKVLPIIKQIRKIGPVAWDCGKNIAVDEQTISMKGHHADKIRITFKRAGDGFMCDALCDDGFTYSIYFRNEPPPPNYTAMGLSPLYARVMWLFDQLKDHGHRCRVDNLYMSCTFAKFCYNHDNKILLEGVARKGRGIPQVVVQEEVKRSIEATTRGTVKAAVLEGDPNCPNLVAVSVYDTKPVHFITMVSECIEWVTKSRKVWNAAIQSLVSVEFLRLNVNNNYNGEMNDVDISDHLRKIYEFNHWLRNKKWCWAIFLYAMEVLLTNAYLVYCSVMDEAGVERAQRRTHYQFLLEIAVAWIDLREHDIRDVVRASAKRIQATLAAMTSTTPGPATRTVAVNASEESPSTFSNQRRSTPVRHLTPMLPSPMTIASPTQKRHKGVATPEEEIAETPFSTTPSSGRAPFFTDHALDPDNGKLSNRLNHFAYQHWPEPPPQGKVV
jgi:hypothetical protein